MLVQHVVNHDPMVVMPISPANLDAASRWLNTKPSQQACMLSIQPHTPHQHTRHPTHNLPPNNILPHNQTLRWHPHYITILSQCVVYWKKVYMYMLLVLMLVKHLLNHYFIIFIVIFIVIVIGIIICLCNYHVYQCYYWYHC